MSKKRDESKDDYEIGHGKPPKSKQFKPGQSGNPKGRPKKPRTMEAALDAELNKLVGYIENGEAKRGRSFELIARMLTGKAMKGDLAALRIIINKSAKGSTEGNVESKEENKERMEMAEELTSFLDDYAQMKRELGAYQEAYDPPPGFRK